MSLTTSSTAPAPGRGEALLVLSALAFSTAGFFSRAAPVDVWAMVFWRNAFGAAALVLGVLAASRGAEAWRLPRSWRDWGVVATASLGTVLYIGSLKNTSVADVSIIYGTAPLLSAGMAWLFLRERASRGTLQAAVLASLGVALTVWGSVGGGTLLGDALAMAMTVALSAMAVLARGSTAPALATALLSASLTAALVLPVGLAGTPGLAVTPHEAAWLAGFGLVAIAIAMPSYIGGAALVPAGRAMLISTLELPIAPLWVWLAFGEVPSTPSLVGGGLVAAAVLWQLASRQENRSSL